MKIGDKLREALKLPSVQSNLCQLRAMAYLARKNDNIGVSVKHFERDRISVYLRETTGHGGDRQIGEGVHLRPLSEVLLQSEK